jgi:Uma2 family endonuclease
MVLPAKRHRFTADEFHRMAEAGIFHEDDRVELIDGEIFAMSAIGRPHSSTVDRLNALFSPLTGRAILRVQNPVRLDDYSEPLPDFQLLEPVDDFYRSKNVEPADVLLLVEVADSSLEFDRSVKSPRYAGTGIRECWIVDLSGETVLVHREPDGEEWREIVRHRRGESIAPLAFPEHALEVDRIVG